MERVVIATRRAGGSGPDRVHARGSRRALVSSMFAAKAVAGMLHTRAPKAGKEGSMTLGTCPSAWSLLILAVWAAAGAFLAVTFSGRKKGG